MPLAMVTTIKLNTFSEGLIFVHLITLMMETALYNKEYKKYLTNENCSAHFHLQLLSPNVNKTHKNCQKNCGTELRQLLLGA